MTTNQTDLETFLQHFGKKGMKWGQHKNSSKPRISNTTKNSIKEGSKVAAGFLAVGGSLGVGMLAHKQAKTELGLRKVAKLLKTDRAGARKFVDAVAAYKGMKPR